MRLLPALTAVLVLALAPNAAGALRDKSGDYKPKALDIVAVGVSGAPNATLVDVRFRGNFERAMNTRALRRAAVAVGVAPADGGAPNVVVTSGRSTKPRDRRTGGLDAGFSFRHGHTLTFVLGGQGPGAIRNLAVVAAARPQRARATAAQDVIGQFIKVAAVFAGHPEANDDEDEVVDAWISHGPAPSDPNMCARVRKELDRAKRELEKWQRRLDRARDELRKERQHPSSGTLEHIKRLDELKGAVTGARLATQRLRGQIAHLTLVLDNHCPDDQPGAAGGDGGTGPAGGPPDEEPFAVPPEAMFTFSPNDPPNAPKAGQPVQFDGSASTPTGHISKYTWQFGPPVPPGNGDPSSGAPSVSQASGPTASVTFSAPGRYPVTLAVYDDQQIPNHAILSRTVFVSGPGMKQNTLDFPEADGGCDGTISAFVEFYIPSYAETPNEAFEKLAGCENATVTITKITRTIGTAPPFPGGKQRLDAWGRREDTYRIEFKVTGGQATAGSVRATVNWH